MLDGTCPEERCADTPSVRGSAPPGGVVPSARPPTRSLRAAGGGLKGCAVFLSEALGPSLPRSVLRERAPHSTVRSHTCRPRWPGPRLSERAVTHRGLARPPLSAPAACPCRVPRSAPGRPSRIPTGSPRSSPTVQPRSLRLGGYVPLNSRRPPVVAAFPQVPQKVQARGTSMYFHRSAVDAHSDLWETTLSTTGLVLFQVISN